MQRKIAAGIESAAGAPGERAVERAHRDVVRHQNAAKPDIAADDLLDHRTGERRWRAVIDRRKHDMRGHRPRHRRQRAEWRKVTVRQHRAVGFDPWAGMVAVDPGAAMPGDMLDDRQHTAAQEPLAEGAAEARHPRRRGAEGAVADHRVGVTHRQIEHRRAIDGDADRS